MTGLPSSASSTGSLHRCGNVDPDLQMNVKADIKGSTACAASGAASRKQPHIRNETLKAEQMRPDRAGVGVVQPGWNDKHNIGLPHFTELVFRYALLEGKKMLDRNPLRFIENLPPTVLAGRL